MINDLEAQKNEGTKEAKDKNAKVIRVASWEDCQQEIAKIVSADSSLVGVWFRGQPNAVWPLTTTLERRTSVPYSVVAYYALISRIQAEIETFTGSTWEMPPSQKIIEWANSYDLFRTDMHAYGYLAHLRHHGFPSPLLDWTASPYIAAYFAFAKVPIDVEEVAIFLFSDQPNNYKAGGSMEPSIFIRGPRVKTHKRHFRQQSQYTICAQYDSEKGWIFKPHQAVFDLGRQDQDLLWKIIVPSSERMKILRLLDKFNLNEFSLFDSEEGLMETLAFREIDAKSSHQ
jgi:hypothetical protein